ncbi:cohesin domain-containing protein [Paenibacillus sp. VTT E-133280]|uniref:cohesin domain-containing protein n=1 Tax=Paenibacillus sp. VTT E-133280 TaxID=1986222 RepID=UPI00117FD0E3|nr:cohesin domain-containing protein [Paenibacillus sp. VTT E-133280]
MNSNRWYKKAVIMTMIAVILSCVSFTNPVVNADASNATPSATLAGSKKVVAPGESFTVKYGITSVSSDVYAQDITFEFDPAVMEYLPDSIRSLQEGVIIINEPTTSTPGKLRVLLASLGSQYPITSDAEIVELGFKAADVIQDTAGVIRLTQAIISDSQGEESVLQPATLTIQIRVNTELSIDVNGDGKVSIGDLAIIAAKYGIDLSSSEWDAVKRLDLDRSGTIDVADLAIVAKKIVEQE